MALRHAEKRRDSTCALADHIAEAALAAWRGLEVRNASPQTCVAAIVAVDGRSRDVLGLGAGTKVARRAAVASDATGEVLRDCHAEVLAVRAFRRHVRAVADAGGGGAFEAVDEAGASEATTPSVRLRAGVALYFRRADISPMHRAATPRPRRE